MKKRGRLSSQLPGLGVKPPRHQGAVAFDSPICEATGSWRAVVNWGWIVAAAAASAASVEDCRARCIRPRRTLEQRYKHL